MNPPVSLPIFFFAIALLVSSMAGFQLSKRTASGDAAERWIAALIPPAAVTLAVLLFYKMLWAGFDEHNWMRLEKIFALARGRPLYYGPGFGPALAALYGPMSALAYWPATWTPYFTTIVPTACVISMLLFFAPVLGLLLIETGGDKRRLYFAFLGFLIFAFTAIYSSSLRMAAFNVHADAPALGLSALACAFLYGRRDSQEWRFVLPAAAAAVLAVWSKQVTVLLLPALALNEWLVSGNRGLRRYLVCLAIAGLAVSCIFLFVFDPRAMFFQMITVPSRHPLKEDGLHALVIAFVKLLRECLLFLPWLILGVLPSLMRLKRYLSFSAWLRDHRWFLFILVASWMLPLSLYSNIKVGGSNNTFTFTNYFLVIGAILAMREGIEKPAAGAGIAGRIGAWMMVAALALAMGIGIPVAFYRALRLPRKTNFALIAYEYAKAHPGETYFPRLSLIHLLAEGKIYHAIDGLMDRRWANLPLTEEHVRKYVPPQAEMIAFYEEGEDHRWLLPLAEFSDSSEHTEALPHFNIYRRKAQSSLRGLT